MGEDKSVLRWGGLAGILSGILFLLSIIITAPTLLPFIDDPEGVVMSFPDIRATLSLIEGLYLLGLILWVTLFVALYRALRGTSLAPTLGSVLGVLGLAMLAVGSLVYVALADVSRLYHAPGATPEEQVILGLVWGGVQGVFIATDSVGFVLLTTGLIVLGVAMLGAPAFGKGFGWVSVALGVVGVVGISLAVVVPLTSIFLVGTFLAAILGLVIFPLLLGWKLYSLSKAA